MHCRAARVCGKDVIVTFELRRSKVTKIFLREDFQPWQANADTF